MYNNRNLEEIEIKIEPEKEMPLEHESFKDWDFFWNKDKKFSSKELDMVSDRVKINRLPEMLYGSNRFYIINQSTNFIYEINPLHMLDLSCFNERKMNIIENISKESNLANSFNDSLNFIYYCPPKINSCHTKIQLEDTLSDFTFSSSYMGTIGKLNDHKLFLNEEKHFSNFDFFNTYPNFFIDKTSEEIPSHKLEQSNPILKYIEINLFEDQLYHDGLSQGKFRFRIMNDCFFGLLRFYVRVDDICVRIYDTRIFHSFGQNYILRDFQVKENSYEELKKKGFELSFEWKCSSNQNDKISKFMDIVYNTKDKIFINEL